MLKTSQGDQIPKMGDKKFDQISRVGVLADGLGRPRIGQGLKSRPRGKEVSEEGKVRSRRKCLSSLENQRRCSVTCTL